MVLFSSVHAVCSIALNVMPGVTTIYCQALGRIYACPPPPPRLGATLRGQTRKTRLPLAVVTTSHAVTYHTVFRGTTTKKEQINVGRGPLGLTSLSNKSSDQTRTRRILLVKCDITRGYIYIATNCWAHSLPTLINPHLIEG